jgi:hypothetical protein
VQPAGLAQGDRALAAVDGDDAPAVGRGDGQRLAVRREGQAGDALRAGLQQPALAALDLPQPHRLVGAAGGQGLAVGREAQGGDGGGVPLVPEHALHAAAGERDQVDLESGFILRGVAGHGQELAVGRQGGAAEVAELLAGDRQPQDAPGFARGDLPEAHRLVGGHRNEHLAVRREEELSDGGRVAARVQHGIGLSAASRARASAGQSRQKAVADSSRMSVPPLQVARETIRRQVDCAIRRFAACGLALTSRQG